MMFRTVPGATTSPGIAPTGRYLVWEYLVRCWRRYLLSSLAEAVGTPLLYLLALGRRARLADRFRAGPASLGGVSYLDYIAPALLVAAAAPGRRGGVVLPRVQPVQVDAGVLGGDGHAGHPGPGLRGRGAVHRHPDGGRVELYYLVLLAFGAAGGATGVLMIPVAMLTGLACAVWVLALGARMRSEGGAFNILFRFVVIPMTLFSGSFFPISEMPLSVRWLAWISPLWHGNELARGARARWPRILAGDWSPGVPGRPAGRRVVRCPPLLSREVDRMTADRPASRWSSGARCRWCSGSSRCSCTRDARRSCWSATCGSTGGPG